MAADSTLQEVIDREGASVFLHRVDGILYPNHPHLPQNFKIQLDLVKEFQIRPDDVITFGFPRSGNHWMFEIVGMILHQSPEYHPVQMTLQMPSFLSTKRLRALSQAPSPRQLASHLRPTQFTSQLPQIKPKIIYIVRNPKDVMVSTYNFVTRLKYSAVYRGKWDNFFELALKGEFMFGSWFDHVLSFERFQREHPDCPVHIVCYEQMKENPEREIQLLAGYLERPMSSQLLKSIIEKIGFETMKKDMIPFKMRGSENRDFIKGAPGFLRKGEVGDWKHWFTKFQSATLDRVFEDKMNGSKLASLVKPYIYLQSSRL